MDYKYTGIILNKKDVGETDRIYVAYTKEAGKIKIIGKGVRKPNAKLAGHLEPVTQSEIFVAKSWGIGKITGAIALDNFLDIKSNVDALDRINYVFKIFGKIIGDQEQDKDIFEILGGFLKGMEKVSRGVGNKSKMDILVLGFLFKLLSEMGYRLEVDKCAHCGEKLRPGSNFFSAEKGGILCIECHKLENKIIKINNEAIKLIRIFLRNKIENLSKLQVPQKDINNLKIVVQESLNWL